MTDDRLAYIDANVARGAALLESKLGSQWDERIDLAALNIHDCATCVIGQVFQSEERTAAQTWFYGQRTLDVGCVAQDYGFIGGNATTAAWRRCG